MAKKKTYLYISGPDDRETVLTQGICPNHWNKIYLFDAKHQSQSVYVAALLYYLEGFSLYRVKVTEPVYIINESEPLLFTLQKHINPQDIEFISNNENGIIIDYPDARNNKVDPLYYPRQVVVERLKELKHSTFARVSFLNGVLEVMAVDKGLQLYKDDPKAPEQWQTLKGILDYGGVTEIEPKGKEQARHFTQLYLARNYFDFKDWILKLNNGQPLPFDSVKDDKKKGKSDQAQEYKSFDELFINQVTTIKCYKVLVDLGIIDEHYHFIEGQIKGAVVVWIKELSTPRVGRKKFIHWQNNDVYAKLISDKFKFKISPELFRSSNISRAIEKYERTIQIKLANNP